MPISEERLQAASVVVQAGVLAAKMCRKTGMSEAETMGMLREGLLEEEKVDSGLVDTTKPGPLADLVCLCIVWLASQEDDLEEIRQRVEELVELARERDVIE